MIELIQKCFGLDKVLYSGHARYEMKTEKFGAITDRIVYEAVCNGKIIEEYLDDKPYPSVLIFGRTNSKRPIHIVCAYDSESDQTIIITVYEPDPARWIDYQRRK
ncbi:MAG: DUF4258 domain-containing protein [Candidatus Anammoxibacter sp.]